MTSALHVKPAHKAVKEYYAALASYAEQGVDHEGAVRSAFQNLLDHCGHKVGWTLIPEQPLPVKGHTIRPDDPQYIVRLVGQVVRVSVETVKIVTSLPAEYGG